MVGSTRSGDVRVLRDWSHGFYVGPSFGYGVTHRRGEKSLGFRAGGGDDECPSDIHPAS